MSHAAPSPQVPALLRFARSLGMARGLVRQPSTDVAPQQPLELYSMEACGKCRRVRQTLTELNLDYLHRSCPFGDSENRRRLVERGGKMQVPYLVDPNTGVELYESAKIVRYLVENYGAEA